jgi:DNA-binding transcriptional LysR family regulator
MDLRQLTAFVTVADVGSVTKAAALLHQVQPALTRQIRALEAELGVTLFERSHRGMTPTADGTLLLDRARRALAELDRARAELRGGEDQDTRGIVTVGVLESLADLLVPPLVSVCRERHPGVELRVVTAYSGHLQEWLDSGDVDLSLLYNVTSSSSLTLRALFEEELWVIAPPAAALHPARPVSWQELSAHPLVLPLPGHGLRVLIDRARAELDVRLDVALQTNSLRLQKLLVLAGHGWTVLPSAGIATDVTAGRLSGAPLGRPSVSRQVVLGLHRATGKSPAVQAVARITAALVDDAVGSGKWPSARPLGAGDDAALGARK